MFRRHFDSLSFYHILVVLLIHCIFITYSVYGAPSKTKSPSDQPTILHQIIADSQKLKNDIEELEQLEDLLLKTKSASSKKRKDERNEDDANDANRLRQIGKILGQNKLGFGEFRTGSKKDNRRGVWIAEPVTKVSVMVVKKESPRIATSSPTSASKENKLKILEKRLMKDLSDGRKRGVSLEDLIKDLRSKKMSNISH
ncbi:Uncharacterised protein at_DN0545 [Pycnogonum litorale]